MSSKKIFKRQLFSIVSVFISNAVFSWTLELQGFRYVLKIGFHRAERFACSPQFSVGFLWVLRFSLTTCLPPGVNGVHGVIKKKP